MWGAFNYNQTPLVTLGMCVLNHEYSKQLAMWDNNGVEAWYIGPEMRGHYRCYRCYITSTGEESISDTVQLFPIKVPITSLSSQDKATDSIRDVITIIHNPVPETPFLEYGPKATTAMEQLAEIFRTNTAP